MRAFPPVVVSGFPNMTPIFMRIWLTKITIVFDLLMVRRQFSQGLRHQPGLKPHMGISHLTFDLRFGDQGRHRVDNDHIDSPAPDQNLCDLKSLFSGIGLGEEEIIDLDPQFLCIVDVQGMLGIDEGCNPALLLGLCNHMEGQRRLS